LRKIVNRDFTESKNLSAGKQGWFPFGKTTADKCWWNNNEKINELSFITLKDYDVLWKTIQDLIHSIIAGRYWFFKSIIPQKFKLYIIIPSKKVKEITLLSIIKSSCLKVNYKAFSHSSACLNAGIYSGFFIVYKCTS